MIKDKLFVFDDIISNEQQENIKSTFFSKLNWFFISDVTDPKNNFQQRPAFTHNFFNENKSVSDYSHLILPIVDASCKKINFTYKNLDFARTFLQLPLNLKNNNLDEPHIDFEKNHIVILYYVLSSDGDTIIFENKFNDKNKNLKIQQKIKPKQGRVVIFDGLYWHTAEQPKTDIRCVININLT